MQSLTLIGNIGKVREIKKIGNSAVAKISLAQSESWRDRNSGEKKVRTTWFEVDLWGPEQSLQSLANSGMLAPGNRVAIKNAAMESSAAIVTTNGQESDRSQSNGTIYWNVRVNSLADFSVEHVTDANRQKSGNGQQPQQNQRQPQNQQQNYQQPPQNQQQNQQQQPQNQQQNYHQQQPQNQQQNYQQPPQNQQQNYQQPPQNQQQNYGAPNPGSFDEFDDEIPF